MAMIRHCSAVHKIQLDTSYEALTQYWAFSWSQKWSILVLLSQDELLGHYPAGCVEPQGLMSRKGISKPWQRGNYEGCERRLWKVNPSLLWRRLARAESSNGDTEVLGAGQVTGKESLSVISQTLLEAIRLCLKYFPENSPELSGSRGCQSLDPQAEAECVRQNMRDSTLPYQSSLPTIFHSS